MKEYRISSKEGVQTFTSEERMTYLKKLSGEIKKEIFNQPEQLFKEEIDTLLDLLKIELIHHFKY